MSAPCPRDPGRKQSGAACAADLLVMADHGVEPCIRFAVRLAVGLLFYTGYGYRHSRVAAAAADGVAVAG